MLEYLEPFSSDIIFVRHPIAVIFLSSEENSDGLYRRGKWHHSLPITGGFLLVSPLVWVDSHRSICTLLLCLSCGWRRDSLKCWPGWRELGRQLSTATFSAGKWAGSDIIQLLPVRPQPSPPNSVTWNRLFYVHIEFFFNFFKFIFIFFFHIEFLKHACGPYFCLSPALILLIKFSYIKIDKRTIWWSVVHPSSILKNC